MSQCQELNPLILTLFGWNGLRFGIKGPGLKRWLALKATIYLYRGLNFAKALSFYESRIRWFGRELKKSCKELLSLIKARAQKLGLIHSRGPKAQKSGLVCVELDFDRWLRDRNYFCPIFGSSEHLIESLFKRRSSFVVLPSGGNKTKDSNGSDYRKFRTSVKVKGFAGKWEKGWNWTELNERVKLELVSCWLEN